MTVRDDFQSLNLAVRYRPRSFATVVGQVHVVEVLRRAVLAGRVPQQLLFSGGSGLGKTTIARIVAGALLCETPMTERDRGDACGSCRSCLEVLDGTHPDLIEFDAASHGGKDEIREIAARAQVMPLRAAVKIYIIDEAHGLSNPGGQAFLKLLEEPPAHVFFMLCTTDPQRMLKTNRGRCVEFELLPPTRAELAENLERVASGQGWNLPSGVLDAVILASDPDLGVRGTVTTLAKLSAVLADPRPPSPEMVSSLLGTPSPVLMRSLTAAITSGDRATALAALESARRSVPDNQLHTALLDWARREVIASLAAPDALEIALLRLKVLLETRPGAGWLDLTVAELTAFLPDPAALAPVAPATTDRAATPRPVEGTETASPVGPAISAGAAQLLAAASPAPPEVRSLIPRCRVTVTESEVELVAPDELVPALTPHVASLRTAAGRLGLPLKLRKASSIPGGA